MRRFQANPELIFMGSDFSRPRMVVEKEKINSQFPGFKFYGYGDKVTSVQGYLRTNFGNSYHIIIEIPDTYPYTRPDVMLPYMTIDSSCPHKYSDNEICVMKSEQWTTAFSLAFVIAKTAIWLNKYDTWKRNGKRRWPGRDQHR